VQRSHHDVERSEGFVVVVQPTVAMDFDFGTVQYVDAAREADDLSPLRSEPPDIQTSGNTEAAAVVGDAEVVVTERGRRGLHGCDRSAAVAPGRVAVEVSPEIGASDQGVMRAR
jgi:hypothetical protein